MNNMNMAQITKQIHQVNGSKNQSKNLNSPKLPPQKSFQQVFENIQKKEELKFSKHAQLRAEERAISLTENEMNRIQDGVKKAEEKGVKTTLVLMDNKAFIVSVDKKTVITTADEKQLKENVFTNIDGAVIV